LSAHVLQPAIGGQFGALSLRFLLPMRDPRPAPRIEDGRATVTLPAAAGHRNQSRFAEAPIAADRLAASSRLPGESGDRRVVKRSVCVRAWE
jgi:hypothetical protein